VNKLTDVAAAFSNVFIEGRKYQLEENLLFKYTAVETLSCSKSTVL
jgi:hypothetical protein